MTVALLFLGLFLATLVAVFSPLVFVIPVAASAASAIFSAKRCHEIPLYWIVGIASSAGLSIAAIQLEVHLLIDDGIASKFDHLKSIATSWPTLACVLGAVVATRLSKTNSQWMRALSGASWGLLTMSICRLTLTA